MTLYYLFKLHQTNYFFNLSACLFNVFLDKMSNVCLKVSMVSYANILDRKPDLGYFAVLY